MPVDKDAVRILVADVGYQEASKRLGIRYDLLRKWAERYKWNKPPAIKPNQHKVTSVTTSPGQAHASILAELSGATKLGFATAARRVADHATRMTPVQVVKSSRGLKNVTEIAEKVHGWNAQSRSTSVFANQAVVIDDATIDELQARLKRLRGEA